MTAVAAVAQPVMSSGYGPSKWVQLNIHEFESRSLHKVLGKKSWNVVMSSIEKNKEII